MAESSLSDRKAKDRPMAMESHLACLVFHLARGLDERDPVVSLAKLGVTLRVYERPLRLSNKSVFGAWDPLLRRIELFGCNDTRSDDQIVETLGHELWHVSNRNDRSPDTEAIAQRFARVWLRELGPARVRQCAAALRSQAPDSGNAAVPVNDRVSGLRQTEIGVGPGLVNIGL